MPTISTAAGVAFGVTYFAYAALYFARKPFAIVKGTLETELDMSRTELAGVDSALLAAYAVGQLLLGHTVRLLGTHTPLVLAYALAGACTAAVGLASTSTLMASLWAAAGFTAAVANPLFCMLLADVMPARIRATAIGAWSSCQQLGGIAANVVSAAVLAQYSWRPVFFTAGAIVASFAPLLLVTIPRHPADSAPRQKRQAQSSPSSPSASPSAFSVPGAAAVAVAYTLVKMSRYCLMFWLPYFLSRHVGMSATAAGTVSAALDLGGGLGSVLSGVACDRWYRGRSFRISQHLSLATAAALLAWTLASAAAEAAPTLTNTSTPTPMPTPTSTSMSTPTVTLTPTLAPTSLATPTWLHVAAILVVGFCIAAPDGILGGASSRTLVDYAGVGNDSALVASVSGIVNGCGSVGAVLQGMLTTQLVHHCGWNGLFISLASAMLVASLCLRSVVRVEAEALSKRNAEAIAKKEG